MGKSRKNQHRRVVPTTPTTTTTESTTTTPIITSTTSSSFNTASSTVTIPTSNLSTTPTTTPILPTTPTNQDNSVVEDETTSTTTTPNPNKRTSILEWCYNERQGLYWVLGCALLGSLVGFGFGTGHLTGNAHQPSPWRTNLSLRIKSCGLYDYFHHNQHQREENGDKEDDDGAILWTMEAWETIKSVTTYSTNLIVTGIRYVGSYTLHIHPSFFSIPILPYYSHSIPNPYTDPRAFDVLREMVVREEGGYVHPDLGFLSPAPCGADRGLGMIRDSYTDCQRKCFKSEYKRHVLSTSEPKSYNHLQNRTSVKDSVRNMTDVTQYTFGQEDVLLRIPLSAQLTRNVALMTLSSLVPVDVQRRAPLEELDDAILLSLFLTHERGRGRDSPYLPYIATLPPEPKCGYASSASQANVVHAAERVGLGSSTSFSSSSNTNNGMDMNLGMLHDLSNPSSSSQNHHNPSSSSIPTPPDVWDTIHLLSYTQNLDVNGWPAEVNKAGEYVDRIAAQLARDYGPYLFIPKNMNVVYAIQWSLCMVSSRGVAGNERWGSLRLVPVMDLVNHEESGGKFLELSGEERLKKGDILDTTEDDSGTFIVRSMRHGRKKPLRKGQELLANYNVPNYSPLDWFLNLGFVPPERSTSWTKIDAALPPIHSSRDSHSHHQHNLAGSYGGGGGGGTITSFENL